MLFLPCLLLAPRVNLWREERIRVASANFALKHHCDVLAATEAHLSREQVSGTELEEALLKGLRRHVASATETLRQRRWRKVVQLFVLLPVQPSLPATGSRSPAVRREGEARGRDGERQDHDASAASASGNAARVAAVVRGVSTILDLPLPNNGDYSREYVCVEHAKVFFTWTAFFMSCFFSSSFSESSIPRMDLDGSNKAR